MCRAEAPSLQESTRAFLCLPLRRCPLPQREAPQQCRCALSHPTLPMPQLLDPGSGHDERIPATKPGAGTVHLQAGRRAVSCAPGLSQGLCRLPQRTLSHTAATLALMLGHLGGAAASSRKMGASCQCPDAGHLIGRERPGSRQCPNRMGKCTRPARPHCHLCPQIAIC